MKKEHILVIRFSALGDVAMAVPVVWAVAKQYPDIRITVLSKDFARTLFDDLAPNVNFMAADLKEEYHGVRGLNALYRRLVAKQFTKVADLHNVLRSDYLRMRFNLGRYRVEHIDKHRKQRRKLTAYKNKIKQQLPTIFGPKKNFEQWIGIAPFAAHQGKIYPPEQMEKIIFQLIQLYPKARIFFFGKGENEDKYFKLWCEQWHQCVNVSLHCENMYQELIVMSHLDVMLSMDSANMHLASLNRNSRCQYLGSYPSHGWFSWL